MIFRIYYSLLVSALILIIYSCASTKQASSDNKEFDLSFIDKKNKPKKKTSYVDANDNLIIADRVLSSRIKEELGIPKDSLIPITSTYRIKELNLGLDRSALSSQKIKNIDALAYFIYLQKINLSFNNINDITPIRNLDKLTHLNFQSNIINDISPIANLKNLVDINFYNNNIKNIDCIAELESLEKINFWDNKIINISAIQRLTKLQTVNLGNNYIIDLYPILDLKELEHLWLNNNLITNPEIISNCSKTLKTLSLGNCGISNLDFLKNCENLESLIIYNNNIKDISCLSKLINLNVLYIPNNDIDDISVLAVLINEGAFRRKGKFTGGFNIDISSNNINYKSSKNKKILNYLYENKVKVKL
ncbi:leucine-rich repeat domain-containing protein [Aureibacter tunicatorum]|uniref:Leucine-rich repeat (LRR) protein n=1 Tax=Aureibacter tunicatorum TaxID=866807 RepID=A0AAE4BT10_9BACT|nr:leucine-rich repeat domain-containing protein [Aureibacter tunicatorum]MDR6241734.1 Leucine-rich repeat (LRR) protein [Aureibacter tunicatorum]BDD07404.1 hypothetical protein AUTU_48870 [Aureibacter tunicatorum]